MPDGSLRYHHSVGHPVVDEDGEVVEFVGTLVDVTEQHLAKMALERENAERRRAEEDLRRSEAFLAEGQKISRTGSWAWNVATGEVSWSAEHFRIFGLDPNATTPSYAAFADRIHPEDRAGFRRHVGESGSRRRRLPMRLPHRHARWRDKICAQPGALNRQRRQTPEFIGTVMDVTERRLAEEALRSALADLERASRLSTMGQLTASIAHEINQPLAAIITNADACLLWLEADRPNLEEARQAATRIVRNGHRASDIIKSVRALTRKSAPEMVSLDINDVIREVIVLMGAEFRRHGVRVETSLRLQSRLRHWRSGPASAGRAEFDHERHRGDGGIPCTASGGCRSDPRTTNPAVCVVAVADSGPGLDPAQADRLFEAFFTTKPEGMGMGLSICRSIVDAHGGRLWASPNLPNGAVFQFTLPAAAGDASKA